jgi:hypothetical protein
VNERSLSIVLPVRDSAGRLPALAAECLAVAARHAADYELLIVVDGGDEATREAAARIAATHGPVAAIYHRRRLGFRHALRDALRVARGDRTLAFDPRQVPVDTLPRLLALADGNAAVFGIRRPARHVLRRTVARLTRLGVPGADLRDPALRLVLVGSALQGAIHAGGPDSRVTTEIAAEARRRGLPITQVEIAPRREDGAGERQRAALGLGAVLVAGCLWLLRRLRPAGWR